MNDLREELSKVMRERRDALQRAWNAEAERDQLQAKLKDLIEAAENAYPYVDDSAWRKELRAALSRAKGE